MKNSRANRKNNDSNENEGRKNVKNKKENEGEERNKEKTNEKREFNSKTIGSVMVIIVKVVQELLRNSRHTLSGIQNLQMILCHYKKDVFLNWFLSNDSRYESYGASRWSNSVKFIKHISVLERLCVTAMLLDFLIILMILWKTRTPRSGYDYGVLHLTTVLIVQRLPEGFCEPASSIVNLAIVRKCIDDSRNTKQQVDRNHTSIKW